MTLISSYLITTKNLSSFFDSLITAQAPATFTHSFLRNLEFKSTNDRLYIGLLKGLGFLDQNGVPTERYFNFLDQPSSKKILAEAIRDAYEDLFAIDKNAQELTTQNVKNKLRTLTQGKYSEKVIGLMAKTFTELAGYAEWNNDDKKGAEDVKKKPKQALPAQKDNKPEVTIEDEPGRDMNKSQLHYNIQIHLPESRDPAVYDVLFTALKKHLF